MSKLSIKEFISLINNNSTTLTLFIKKSSVERKSTGKMLSTIEDQNLGLSNKEFINLFKYSYKQDELIKKIMAGYFLPPEKPHNKKSRHSYHIDMKNYKHNILNYKEERMTFLRKYFFNFNKSVYPFLFHMKHNFNDDLIFNDNSSLNNFNIEKLDNYIPFKVKFKNEKQLVDFLYDFINFSDGKEWRALFFLSSKSFENDVSFNTFFSNQDIHFREELLALKVSSTIIPQLVEFSRRLNKEKLNENMGKINKLIQLSGNPKLDTIENLLGFKFIDSKTLEKNNLINIVSVKKMIDWLKLYNDFDELRNIDKKLYREIKKLIANGSSLSDINDILSISENTFKEISVSLNYGDLKNKVNETRNSLMFFNFI